jgi:antitoxin component YwqK of YwqJK toxin-antitoxin module
MNNVNLVTSVSVLFLCIKSSLCFSTTDTIYRKKHYTSVEYYPDKKVKSFGNLKDSVKSGEWIYFGQNGKLLAEGSYLNGKKIGKWIYVDLRDKKHKHTWEPGEQPEEQLKFESGKLIMYDYLNKKDPSGLIRLNFKFGVLQYYILD